MRQSGLVGERRSEKPHVFRLRTPRNDQTRGSGAVDAALTGSGAPSLTNGSTVTRADAAKRTSDEQGMTKMNVASLAFRAPPSSERNAASAGKEQLEGLDLPSCVVIQAKLHRCEADLASARRIMREMKPSSREELQRRLAQIAAVALLSALAIGGWAF